MPAATILVVEDEEPVREVLREMLEGAGYHVLTAGDGLEGLAQLERVTPQLVLSDVRMPRMDGYQFHEAVRARPQWVHVPFVFLSGLGADADVRAGKRLGADDYIVKPVLEEDLLVAVRARLQRHAQLAAAREEQVEALKRTILNTLNHELRTPLTYLSGYAELLRDSGGALGEETLRQALDGILAGRDRLCRLVEDLVLLVDLNTGAAQQAYERRRRRIEDLPALLDGVLSRERARAEEHGVSLVGEYATPLPAVLGEPEALASAMARLVDNGIKYSKKEGGEVRVTARAGREGGVVIAVSDQGIGMPAEELHRISDLFYQFDRESREQQGTGTGLTIVRWIVAVHGGRLVLASAPGAGLTATVELPAT